MNYHMITILPFIFLTWLSLRKPSSSTTGHLSQEHDNYNSIIKSIINKNNVSHRSFRSCSSEYDLQLFLPQMISIICGGGGSAGAFLKFPGGDSPAPSIATSFETSMIHEENKQHFACAIEKCLWAKSLRSDVFASRYSTTVQVCS